MTTYDVAREFGVTMTTVVNWCKQGLIKNTTTLGGHRRISKEEVSRVKQEMFGA
jgi:excisionase family DNA binding protein